MTLGDGTCHPVPRGRGSCGFGWEYKENLVYWLGPDAFSGSGDRTQKGGRSAMVGNR